MFDILFSYTLQSNDLKVVVSYLRSNEQISRIGLWGRSMGAVTSLLYGAEDPSIAGMVLDSAFSNLFNLMMELVDVYKIRLPKFTVKVALQYMRRMIQKKAKFDIMDINALKVAPKTFIPALFGHAKGDKFIQPHHSDLISNSYALNKIDYLQGDKNMIKFEGDHNSSRPQFYYDSVSIFFHNVLHPPTVSPACSGKYEKYYDLGDLQVDAGIEESLFYEMIAGQPLGIDAASTSSAPPSILTTDSVGDFLPRIIQVRNSLVNDVNSDNAHERSQLQVIVDIPIGVLFSVIKLSSMTSLVVKPKSVVLIQAQLERAGEDVPLWAVMVNLFQIAPHRTTMIWSLFLSLIHTQVPLLEYKDQCTGLGYGLDLLTNNRASDSWCKLKFGFIEIVSLSPVTLKVLATPLRTTQHAAADVEREKKKGAKKSGRDKFEKLEALSQRLRLCILKRVKHRRNHSS
ncbi:hypothetical protein Ccrd_026667 [Cynara cardunculus var. scolymus]|uniref:Serine aminopeptidase S33 domain-containing protein n=1 Tax=Cynara cardunculus var. scolymus TaxID=59895 RepID=A0A118JSD8_CYNCS|nr:hypothetical protein Ccrd_026667 [Cynara cardunculus var. scolymus]